MYLANECFYAMYNDKLAIRRGMRDLSENSLLIYCPIIITVPFRL